MRLMETGLKRKKLEFFSTTIRAKARIHSTRLRKKTRIISPSLRDMLDLWIWNRLLCPTRRESRGEKRYLLELRSRYWPFGHGGGGTCELMTVWTETLTRNKKSMRIVGKTSGLYPTDLQTATSMVLLLRSKEGFLWSSFTTVANLYTGEKHNWPI